MKFYKKLLIFLFLIASVNSFSQIPYPIIQKYINPTPDAASQNWDIITDNNGFLYVANSNGLLYFNGVEWKMLLLPNEQAVRRFFKTPNGKIFIGGQGEIGYLKKSHSGKLEYVSLISFIPRKERTFKDIWAIFYKNSTLYFQSSNKIFIKKAKQDSFSVFSFKNKIHRSFFVHSTFYTRIHHQGLYLFKNKHLIKAPNSNYFADRQILAMFPHKNKFYFVTRANGILNYSPQTGQTKKINLPDNLAKKLAKNLVFSAIQMRNKKYVFTTLQNGIIITDSLFNIELELNSSSGLSDDMVIKVYEDALGNLWAATGNGLSYILLNSDFTTIDKNIGFDGSAYTSLFFDNQILIGASNGLWRIKNNTCIHSKEFVNQLWSLQVFDNKVYGGYRSDLIEIDKDKILNSDFSENVWKVIKALNNREMLVGTYTQGMAIYERQDTLWKFKTKIKAFAGSVRFTETDSLGNIWISDAGTGVYKVKIDYKTDSVIEKHFYNQKKGFPENINNYVFKIKDFLKERIVFATKKGIYRYDYNLDSILPFKKMQNLIGDKETDLFSQDSFGNIWYQSYADKEYFHGFLQPLKSGKYDKVEAEFSKFKDLYIETYSFSKGYTIFNTTKGLFFYLGNKDNSIKNKQFKSVITKLSVNDSILYSSPGKIRNRYEIAPNPSSLKFSYGALYFEDFDRIDYRYKLEGYDRKWSKWTKLNYKEYTNLSPGNYTFLIEAKNIYKEIGQKSSLAFSIKAAWFQSKWMFFFYSIFLIFLIWFILKIYTYKLKQDKIKLENIVSQRTEEINQQKEELTVIADNLKEANQLILGKNENLDYANNQIKKRNRQIVESINYAQTIQSALLPTTEILDTVFEDNFILYQPKDIVSGDFYWIRNFTDLIVIIAADSTGHGVPGGFMSMLGIAFLNEIIVSEENLNAAYILESLRNKVKNVFNRHNKTGEQSNGMDLALIVYDKKTKILKFSGANNPVFVVKANGDSVVLKGQRQPIGNYRREVPFSSQNLQLESGDWIYLYSDGYQDQIGELMQQRMKSTPFRNLLVAETKFRGVEQKNNLEAKFLSWKGKTVQMDDILVMGMKV